MIRGYVYDRLRMMSSAGTRQWFKRQPWFTPVSRVVFGNNVYSKSYFDDVERMEAASVEAMAEWVCAHLHPARIIDIGCGPGHFMESLHRRGVATRGVDVSSAAIAKVRAKGLEADWFDLTDPASALPGAPYDLAISCEVAEHLDSQYAGLFVDKLTQAAPRIYLTAAEPQPPGEPLGMFHVNEQPNQYWIDLMASRGFALDETATRQARDEFLAKPEMMTYLQKPMIFSKPGAVQTSSE